MKGFAKLISLPPQVNFYFFPSTGKGCSGGLLEGSVAACIALLHNCPKNRWKVETELPFMS